MKALATSDLKNTAVVNDFNYGTFFKGDKKTFVKDSLAAIKLVTYKPNYIKYISNNTNAGVAVFSEIYYPKGWNVTIDGKNASHFQADYVLRGLQIPAGKHTIEFKFEPQVVKTGSSIALISSIFMLLLLIGGIYYQRTKK